ncbi:MAG TPA: phosphotransferase, partial [Xanthomonadales bacterium]|nr:phosphotransferase [Xanthomonadales bacterium]
MPEINSDSRLQQATMWAHEKLKGEPFSIETISADASFRRYFRIVPANGKETLVLMDAPPDKEDSRPFIDVAGRLREGGVRAPVIHHFDLDLGFGILEDFGDELYRSIITQETAPQVFPELFSVLEGMARNVLSGGLPNYTEEALQADLDLFTDWYLARHRNRQLTSEETRSWEFLCDALIKSAMSQPQVFVHKDFHSCNLLREPGKEPGVIDFQDAVHGPISYDFISLVWDRYIHWPRSQIETWMADMHQRLQPDFALEDWIRYCDLMGLQRNIKVVGIFARLF